MLRSLIFLALTYKLTISQETELKLITLKANPTINYSASGLKILPSQRERTLQVESIKTFLVYVSLWV